MTDCHGPSRHRLGTAFVTRSGRRNAEKRVSSAPIDGKCSYTTPGAVDANQQRPGASLVAAAMGLKAAARLPTVGTTVEQTRRLRCESRVDPPRVPAAEPLEESFAWAISPHCGERWPLDRLWTIARSGDRRHRRLGRARSMAAADSSSAMPTPWRTQTTSGPEAAPLAASPESALMGDPGFEPGTSSLSEKRSNRLS
jgi:hypothetical protein